MKHGFSLLELSIVLVIIGLLAGGVMTGQSLIRAAELRSISSEYTRYRTAISTFRDKYNAIPGDMTNAQSFWGNAAACPGIFSTAAGGTCNGDGNGQILPTATNANEIYRFWQHLALGSLVEGSFTGTSASGVYSTTNSSIGQNSPASKVGNAGWSIYYIGTIPTSSTAWSEGNYGNAFLFGTTAFQPTIGAVLKPEEAWNIDTKLDDGKPGTGIVSIPESQGTTCFDLAASATVSMAASVYLLTSTNVTCSLVMSSGY